MLKVDWPAVRAHAVIHGIRQAARDFGISEDAVRQRSAREKWLSPSPQLVTTHSDSSPKVTKPHEAALMARQRMDARTHKYGRSYAHDALRHAARLAKRNPAVALAEAPNVKAAVSVAQAANVAGFERQERAAPSQVLVAIGMSGIDLSASASTPLIHESQLPIEIEQDRNL